MMDRHTVDVLVVGLGPAGCRAAEAAAAAGLTVLGIDRRRQAGEPVQCAEFVPALLGQELDTPIAARRQAIREMVTFVEDAPPDSRDDFSGRMIDRAAFDRELLNRARTAGAECRFGTVLRSLDAEGSAPLSSGVQVHPRLVIGADGPRSTVGRAIGRINARLVETRQMTVPLRVPHAATDIFLSADLVGGYGWLFPKGDVANVGAGVLPAARGRLKGLVEALRRRLLDEGRIGAEILGHTGGAIPVGGMLTPHGRLEAVPVLLAGDAAGLTNPITGAGIPAAVISGELAGEAAAAWLGGDAAALDTYEEDLTDIFGPSLGRALQRRAEIVSKHDAGRSPNAADLRRTWIAYPEYWAA